MPDYRCSHCGQVHAGPAFSHEIEAPDRWWQISEFKRGEGELDEELCVVDNREFFIKGNLWISVRDGEQEFNWTVWASISREDFERSVELWDFAGREMEPAYPGRLANELALYPDSLGLEVKVHTLSVGERPMVALQPTEHPLGLEQRNGVRLARVREIGEFVLHAEDRSKVG